MLSFENTENTFDLFLKKTCCFGKSEVVTLTPGPKELRVLTNPTFNLFIAIFMQFFDTAVLCSLLDEPCLLLNHVYF